MTRGNPFPESEQKAFLRRHYLGILAEYKDSVGRKLGYFGLPSAEMRDVLVWKSLLGHITAVEREDGIALSMYRTASLIGVRDRTIIIERDLADTTRLLAYDDELAVTALSAMSPPLQDRIKKARSARHDVFNLDLCGGFLYPDNRGESENAAVLSNIINFQARRRLPFFLLLTFNLRDTGHDDYDTFIREALSELEARNVDVSEIMRFYLSKRVRDQPPQLRRLRFSVPAFVQKTALAKYLVTNLGGWTYKTFYNVGLFLQPRKGQSSLGMIWPPIDEFADLMGAPVTRVQPSAFNGPSLQELPAPLLEA